MTISTTPEIWLLRGSRHGDNAQLEELARRIGSPYVDKELAFNGLHVLPNWLVGPRIVTLGNAGVLNLAPPWPDLILACGRRSVPVARFIRQASGGRTKLVHLGRPRAPLESFDLVITTPQYRLPPEPNVILLPVPFSPRVEVAKTELAIWQEEWRQLPRPWTVLAIGAGKYPLRFDVRQLNRLCREVLQMADSRGGSILAVSSPRTPSFVVPYLRKALGDRGRVHGWGEGANPYRAALALADRLVVTSDSMSMTGEAVHSGKPVHVFRLPRSSLAVRWDTKNQLFAWLARKGLLTPPRDMSAVLDALIERGYVVELGSGAEPAARMCVDSAFDEAVRRVRGLLFS